MTPEQAIYRANRAQEVLENEAYIKAFEDITQELHDQWEQSPARDEAGRQSIWLMLKMLQKVQAALKATMDSGKLAKAELRHKQTMAEKARAWLS